MEEFYTFLMEELLTITEEIDNPSSIAHEVCLTFALDNNPLPESFFKLYTAPVKVDQDLLYNALAYFCGAEFLTVNCDCEPGDKPYCDINNISQNSFFDLGHEDFNEMTEDWMSISQTIESLREAIFDDNPIS